MILVFLVLDKAKTKQKHKDTHSVLFHGEMDARKDLEVSAYCENSTTLLLYYYCEMQLIFA